MKLLVLLFILVLLGSCAPKKVCGGKGDKRCVDLNIKTNINIVALQ